MASEPHIVNAGKCDFLLQHLHSVVLYVCWFLPCACSRDTVKISMDTFIKRFQPDVYEKWRMGEDHGPHPEELNRTSPVK